MAEKDVARLTPVSAYMDNGYYGTPRTFFYRNRMKLTAFKSSDNSRDRSPENSNLPRIDLA
jgi:hypothetical protein